MNKLSRKKIFFLLTVLVTLLFSTLLAFLYNQSMIPYFAYHTMIQVIALPLFLLLGYLLGSVLSKKEFLYATIISIIFLLLSLWISSFQLVLLWQLLKCIVFCIGAFYAKEKKIR